MKLFKRNPEYKNIVKYIMIAVLSISAPALLAATEDGGQAGQSMNWLIVIFKIAGSAVGIFFALAGLYMAGMPLLKKAASESNGGGPNVPWVKPLILGIGLCAVSSGAVGILLTSSHITSNGSSVKIQAFDTSSSSSS